MFLLKLFQKPDVIFIEQPEIIDAVFSHHKALEAHTKGKTAVNLRVDAAVCQNLGMHHAAAPKLNPAFPFAEAAAFTMAHKALGVHLC